MPSQCDSFTVRRRRAMADLHEATKATSLKGNEAPDAHQNDAAQNWQFREYPETYDDGRYGGWQSQWSDEQAIFLGSGFYKIEAQNPQV
jgi:hypothetical protein